ncbi:MAG: von Willebrand factor type A [Parcubacteria group bacterium Gr01-1014_31]|nr:MAG: von Willebrand factor type A [Parcubacteria group bacterium Gr01-1014_31]
MFTSKMTIRRWAKGTATLVVSGLVFAIFQSALIGVSATLLPILESINHLDFGMVFPGEQLDETFTITLAPEFLGQSQDYWIEEKRKPLPPEHPEYPDGGDPELPGYYRDLCPYISLTGETGEGDVPANATLTESTDETDVWTVLLDAPAIADPTSGGVAQDHKGGIVTTNGEFGCDLSVNIDPSCGNGIMEPGEECDLGPQNGQPGASCSASCTTQQCTGPVDVVLIIDRSGSMLFDSGQRFVDAKAAAKGFVDLLTPNDQASLVSFATSVTLDQTLTNNYPLVKTKIDALVAVGATNIGDAIKTANTELTSVRMRPAAAHVEILLTDGKANKPFGPGYGEYAADVTYAINRAQDAANASTTIFTIGLGSNVNSTMLQQIATMTGGQYYFSPSSGDLAAIYNTIAGQLCE